MGFSFGGEFNFGGGNGFTSTGGGAIGGGGVGGVDVGIGDLGGGSAFDPGLSGGNLLLEGLFGSLFPTSGGLPAPVASGLRQNIGQQDLLNFLFGGGSSGGGSANGFLGIPGTGGIDSILGTILGGIGGAAGKVGEILGGIFGGGGESGGLGGVLGPLLESILGGGAQGAGGNAAGLLGALLGLGGAAFGDRSSEQKVRVPPIGPEEAALFGINLQLAQNQLAAYNQSQGTQGVGNQFLTELYNQSIASQQGAGIVNNQLTQAAIEQGRRDTINGLGIGDQLYRTGVYNDFTGNNEATPGQLANIQGAADQTIQAGLSDIGRFRDESLNQIRLNSAARGLRPSDTPIQNDFANVAQEAGRNASNFISGVRAQQFNQQLQFPLQANQLRLGQFQANQSQNLARIALQEQLAQLAQQQRLQLGSQIAGTGLGLTPSQSPVSVAGQIGNRLTGNQTITTTGSQSGQFGNIGQALGGLGKVLAGG